MSVVISSQSHSCIKSSIHCKWSLRREDRCGEGRFGENLKRKRESKNEKCKKFTSTPFFGSYRSMLNRQISTDIPSRRRERLFFLISSPCEGICVWWHTWWSPDKVTCGGPGPGQHRILVGGGRWGASSDTDTPASHWLRMDLKTVFTSKCLIPRWWWWMIKLLYQHFLIQFRGGASGA